MKRTVLTGGLLLCALVLGVSLVVQAAESVPEDGIAVSPSTLVMGSQGTWVTVHADVPYRDVAVATVTLNGIPVAATFADNQGDLVAKFLIDLVKDHPDVRPPSADVTLRALLDDGSEFVATDSIRVLASTGR
jgi:hypothetical protein